MQETSLLDFGRNLRAEAVGAGSFVRHDESPCLLDGSSNAIRVPWHDCLQVNNLARNAVLRYASSCSLQPSNLRAPPDECDVRPFKHDFSLAQGQLVILHWHLRRRLPVQHLRFKKEHRIRISDGCQQQALGLNRATWHNDLETRTVSEVALNTLAVVHAAVSHGGTRRPDHNVSSTANCIAIPVLGHLVDNLVEGRKDVVSELHLRDGRVPRHRQPHCKTCDGLLRNGCIHDTLRTKLLA
mmetsp:Transcript_9749/g.27182  ORF Transcript_9749/g.27182 Transcript_9749/m.27182 type:complete len:241 (+) Transcript_9749:317-1039(+)